MTDPTPGVGIASGLQKYQYCITTTAGGGNCGAGALVTWVDGAPLTGTTLSRTGLALVDGSTYYVCVRTYDIAGNGGILLTCSNGVKVDGIPPSAPAASRDGVGPATDIQWTGSATTLSSNWGAATDVNGIGQYEYCLSTATSCGGTVIKNWTGNALALTQTSGSLTLADGQVYFSCVRATDTAGNLGPALCSNGQTVDVSAPTNPTTVNDGPFVDITWNPSLSALQANWTGGADAISGIQRWEYCISTGANCAGTIVKNWATNGTATTSSDIALTLVEGEQYVVCVRAFDNVGNGSVGSSCSNGQRVDTLATPLPGTVDDGPAADVDVQSNLTTINATWPAVTDTAPGIGFASGLQKYQYCISTSSTGATCAGAALVPWTDGAPLTGTALTRSGLTLADGATYFVCIRTQDVAGNMTGGSRCSDGVKVDGVAPTWPGGSASNDGAGPGDVAWTTSLTSLSSNWTAAADGNGIGTYEYCLSTATGCAGTVVQGWTGNGLALTQTSGALALVDGQVYYSCVRATDTAGNVGAPLCSNGQTVDATAPVNPTGVNDGLAADITWVQSLTALSANWTGGGDTGGSGIARWEYCISTGASCGGTIVKNWATNALATTETSSALTLVEGQLYVTCVRAFDIAGNPSVGSTCSNGQRVDTIAPPLSAGVNDGVAADIAFQSSGTTISANWSPVADPAPGVGVASGLQRYQYCVSVSASGATCSSTALVTWTDAAPLTGTSVTRSGLTLANGATYYVCIRSFDVALNTTGTSACSNGNTIDLGPPTASWTNWTENSQYLFSPASTSTLWYNPAAPLEASIVATATVTATDPGAGMNRVDFPSLGAGGAWGPGGSDSSVGPANTWTWGYTFTGGGAIGDPATNNATAYDNGGASTGSPALDFNIQPDSAPPSGGSMPLLSGLQSSTELAQTIPLGTDTDSGVGSYAIDVQYAPLVDGVCQAWDPWVTNSSVGTAVNGTTLTLNHHINEDLPYDHLEDYNDSFCWRDQVRVTDNVGNSYTIAANGLKQFDFSNPDVAITSPAAGSSQGGTFSIGGTTDDVWAGGGVEYANTGSGIDQVTVTYLLPDGPDADALPDASGSACPPVTSFGGPWTALTWTCSWNTSSLPDGTYTLSARARDRSGRLSTIATRNFLIDNAAPVHAWHSFTDNGSPSMHTLGNVAWVNPNAPIGTYQLDARVTAYDLGSGVNRVEFPPLGTGWSPAGTTNGVFTSPLPALNGYTKAYTFTNPASLAAPGVQQARAFDGSGNNSPAPFEIRLDGTAPTGMGASVVNGVQNTPIVTVSLAAGSEGALESGLGSWSLEYDVAPLANDVCGTFTNAWASAASGVGIAPATYSHDVTALGSQCYRYHLLVTDNVGNVNTSTPATARRVDLVKPTVAITTPAAGSIQGSSVAITGTATDAHSGVDHVRLTWTGPSSSSGLICDPATLTGSSPTWGYNCTWATGLLPDGAYTIIATSYDRATNASTTTSVGITLDNFPPFVGFHSFAETTPYTYWAGPIGSNPLLWFNPAAPAGSYSFDVLINANDPSGVSRVEFDGAGTGWTPGAAVGTQTVGVGPATRYAQTYTFNTATPGLVDPPTLTARAFDVANNPGTTTFDIQADSAIPVAGAVTYTNGFVSSTSVTVNLDTGNDGAGSGIASWQLLRSNGTLAGTTCNAWSAYSTVVASGLGTLVGSRPDTVTDPGCFRYRLRVTDNVGNVHDIDGTSELKVDLVPPVGTLAITPATNPTYQHLAAPNQLFVNTSPGHGGTFSVDVSGATAASGILDVNFPLLAAGFTGDGVSPGPGPNISRTYTWTPGATAPAAGKFARVRSNSLGQLDLPFSVIADAAAPVGATATHASGFTTGSTVSVTFTIGNDGSGSGIRDSQLERQTGTLAAGACTWSGSWTPAGALNATGPYADSGLVHATCYRYRVRVTDRVDNVGYSATSTPIMVDQTAPTGASIVLAEGVNPNRQYLANPTTMWVNPTPGGAANFTATVTATDPESGTGAATWPSLGSTFVTTPAGFNATYAWSAGAVAPSAATSVVQVANGAGMTTPVPFTVLVDGTNPTGSTLDQQNGYDTDFSVDLAFTNGGDGAGSGIATWRIERRSATYNLGLDTCTGWGSWGTYPLPTGQPTSPYVDTGVTQPNCYQYRIVEVDNVGNQSAVADGDTAKVINDITPPTAFNLTFPANPALPAITTAAAAPSCSTVPTYSTATPAFTWTASTDGESGLSGYDTYVDGIGTVDGTVLAPATTWTPPALADGAHTLGVRARDNQGNFTNAGPAFPTNVRVDLTAPTATLGAPANAAWTIDTTPTLSWSAADGNCVARVEVYVDDLVTPIAVASGSENSWTPTGALASGMHSWRVEAIDTLGNRTSSTTRTFGTDVTPPTAFAVLTPTAGQTVRGFVNASWTAATDADSGLAAANAYEIWVDGSLKLSVGPGVTSATVPGVTNGIHSLYVRAIDGVGNTMSTMAVSFTGYGAIPAPVLVSPTNNTRTNVVPALDWNWPSDGGPAPTDYDVYLDGVLVGSETHPTSIHTIADPGDGVHTWRIEQHDPYTGTATSGTWSFNLDRTLPVNPGPLTRVATTVTWPAPTDPAAPTASGINYQEFWINDGVNPPTSSLMSAGSTSRNYGTLPDGNYTMWVRAYDRAGNFADTPTLLVVNDSLPPTAFNLNAPAALPALPAITNGGVPPTCESDATFTTATPTLTWQASSDATSGLAGYDVLVDGTLVTSVGPAVTSHTLAAPLSGGLHTWQVVARDNFGLTRASTPAPMSVRVDTASPTMAFGAPVDNGYTSDTTPTLTFSAGDESCAARIEVTVDGTVRAVLTGGATGWTVPTPLSEGAHSWALRAYDSVGNITSAGAPRTLNIDTTGPTAVTAIFPTNAGSAPEQMMTFSWSAGSDAGSGVDHYDLIVDGAPSGTGLTATTRGTFPIYAGAHTWSIRAYDAVGNSTLFSFSFTATPVPDVTAPDPFNLLSPADNAAFVAGNSLTWQPAYDFKGVTQYRVYIDGALSGTTAGNVTSYTPNVGSGSPLCTVDFDPTPDASCVTGLRYSRGSQGTTTTNAATTTPDWNLASYAGWSTGGALGVGDPTATPDYAVGSGYDGDRVWTSAEYDMSVPAGGADVRLEHRYDFSMIGQNAYDGGSIEIKVDTANDGFANDTWAPTCVYGTKGTYGTSIRCTHEIVEANGGFNVVMWGGSATAQPLWHQNAFSGSSGGTVQTKLRMAAFAGKNVKLRFRIGMDGCYAGMPTTRATQCSQQGITNPKTAKWRIDNISLADPALLPGPHTWYVQARDAAGNSRTSNQTWTFNLS
ncbi:MAG: Cable pili-associated 22 kDa adhesin protein [Thermoleophilia bacterium]|nr:Cable pili-associated 22 kDa adhesin protein [Thermoleophilia bacterium]